MTIPIIYYVMQALAAQPVFEPPGGYPYVIESKHNNNGKRKPRR